MTDNKPKNDALDSFFSSIGSEKKKVKEEKRELIGDISLDDVFSTINEETKKLKAKRNKQKQEKEQLKKDAKAFENFLFSESKPAGGFTNIKDAISAEHVEDIEVAVEALEQVDKEDEGTIDHAIKILDKLNEQNETTEDSTPELAKIRKELDVLKQIVNTQGGGGEVRLQYLDDIVGVATNLSEYDGMYLSVDTTGPTGQQFKFQGVNAGAGGTWGIDPVGIHTVKKVGIGTTAQTDYSLYVKGDAAITGKLDVTGDITYDEVSGRNINITGISTLSGVNITAGVVTATAFYGDGEGLTGAVSYTHLTLPTKA